MTDSRKLSILIPALWCFLGLCVILLITAWLGGVHNSRSCFYRPTSKPADPSKSDFAPKIYPLFSKGTRPLDETIIPYVFYRHSAPDRDPHLYLDIVDNTGSYGYKDKISVTIESLKVRNGSGGENALITPYSPRTFSLVTRYMSLSEDLGNVSGDVLDLTVSGFVLTDAGERKRFSHDLRWQRTSFARTDLGIVLGE